MKFRLNWWHHQNGRNAEHSKVFHNGYDKTKHENILWQHNDYIDALCHWCNQCAAIASDTDSTYIGAIDNKLTMNLKQQIYEKCMLFIHNWNKQVINDFIHIWNLRCGCLSSLFFRGTSVHFCEKNMQNKWRWAYQNGSLLTHSDVVSII